MTLNCPPLISLPGDINMDFGFILSLSVTQKQITMIHGRTINYALLAWEGDAPCYVRDLGTRKPPYTGTYQSYNQNGGRR